MEVGRTNDTMMIGVELEMLFFTDVLQGHYLRNQCVQSMMTRNLMFKRITLLRGLRDHGIEATVVNPAAPSSDWQSLRSTHWLIHEDQSIKPNKNDPRLSSEELYWIGIEVSSPPLPMNSKSLEHISLVAQLLTSFGGETPPTTGFHVHVSLTRGYTLEHLKGVFGIASVAYKQFRQFHSKKRVMSKYCVCPSVQFEVQTPSAIALAVEDCTDMEALINLVHLPLEAQLEPHLYYLPQSRSRYTAVNYMNIFNKRQETIEFRTHRGTLDKDEIRRWILTCTAIVELGSKYSSVFDPLIWKIDVDHADDGRNYTAAHLFRDLGKSELAELWANSLHLHTWGPKDRYKGLKKLLVRRNGQLSFDWNVLNESEDDEPQGEDREPVDSAEIWDVFDRSQSSNQHLGW